MYRLLELGEIIEEGDEYYISDNDRYKKFITSIGLPVGKLQIEVKARRPLGDYKIRDESVHEAIRMILVLADEDENVTKEDRNYARNYLLELLK